jgi:alpha-mannosidase
MLDYTGKPDSVQCQESFHELEDASGVSQHHDGVSGTAKQHVANDYSKRLQKGVDGVSTCTTRKIKRLLLGGNATDYLKDLSFCQLLNETKCDVSQVSLAVSRLTSDANL